MQWLRPAGWNFSLHPWGAGQLPSANTREIRVTRKLHEDVTACIAPNFFKLPPGWNDPHDCSRGDMCCYCCAWPTEVGAVCFCPVPGRMLAWRNDWNAAPWLTSHTSAQTSVSSSRIQFFCADLTLEPETKVNLCAFVFVCALLRLFVKPRTKVLELSYYACTRQMDSIWLSLCRVFQGCSFHAEDWSYKVGCSAGPQLAIEDRSKSSQKTNTQSQEIGPAALLAAQTKNITVITQQKRITHVNENRPE